MNDALPSRAASFRPVLFGAIALSLIAGCSSLHASGAAPATVSASSDTASSIGVDVGLGTIPPGDDGAGNGDEGGFPGDDGGGGGGGGFGQGTPLVGDAYSKAEASALAKYPGTIQTIEQRDDGSIVVHVIQADGSEIHVLEDKNYVVTGSDAGRGGRGFPGGPQQETPTTFNA